MKLPSISIVTLNYDAEPAIWEKVLKSIRDQDYPKRLIEHLVMDGGSTNGSVKIAKHYGCTIYEMPELRNNSEGRKGWGIRYAKNEIVAFIESDNILVGKDWFRKMVKPFVSDKRISGAFSIHNSFRKHMPALTRYCALIGINDPTVYYLGKSEKMPRFQSTYKRGEILKDNPDFTTVRFTKQTLPTLGDNGHLVRRTIITKVNKKPEKFLHTDAFYQLTGLGFDTYGVVKNSIIHYTGSKIFDLYKRRITFKQNFFDNQSTSRLYRVFDNRSRSDNFKLALFIFYSLTVVQPLMISIRGFLSVPDPAWFLHPVVCIVAVCSYGVSEVLSKLHSYDK